MEDILRSKNDVRPRIGALTQHISQCFILCGVSRVSLLVTVNSDKGRNSTAAGPVYLAMPREVTFHDDDFSSNKYNRKISGYYIYAIELETISEISRKAQETIRRQTRG